SDMDMVRRTAQVMLDLMNKAPGGKQKPLVATAEEVAQRVSPVIDRLREVNPSPEPLKSMSAVIYSKYLKAQHDKGQRGSADDEAIYGAHAEGPNLQKAIAAIQSAMSRAAMTEGGVPAAPLKLG